MILQPIRKMPNAFTRDEILIQIYILGALKNFSKKFKHSEDIQKILVFLTQ